MDPWTKKLFLASQALQAMVCRPCEVALWLPGLLPAVSALLTLQDSKDILSVHLG